MIEKKNGKIELFRFVFALTVLFYHTVKWNCDPISLSHGVHFAFFPKGNMGVDFFFILSGLLMARTAFNKEGLPVSNSEYGNFVWRKYKTVFPQHSVAFVLTLILTIVVENIVGMRNVFQLIIDNIPNFFLIFMTGVKVGDVNGPIWYISAMLVGVAILYPICRKWYVPFTHFIAPLIGILMLGYFEQTSGSVVDNLAWEVIMFKGTLRGIADLMLGTAAFEVARYVSELGAANTKRGGWFILIAESGLLFLTIIFMVLTLPKIYQVYEVILFFFLLCLMFSGKAKGSELFNNKACYFLGKYSLSIYVSQRTGFYLMCLLPYDLSTAARCIMTVIMTFVVALIIRWLAKYVERVIIKFEILMIKK